MGKIGQNPKTGQAILDCRDPIMDSLKSLVKLI